MPQNDPWAAFRTQQQAAPQPAPQPMNVQPQPFPGAQPIRVKRNPAKVLEEQAKQTRTALDINQDGRAAEALDMERERLRIAQEAAALAKANRAANAGVETNAGQDQAAQHVISLETELGILNDIRGKDPKAIKPGLGEVVAGTMTDNPELLGMTRGEQRQRSSASYRNVIESSLYLLTGAAYNAEQYKGQIETMTPLYTDSGPVLKDKEARLRAVIAGARSRAGPANAKVQEALSALESYLPQMYGGEPADTAPLAPDMGPVAEPARKLSTTKDAVPIPAEMQAEYENFFKANPPGKMTLEGYLQMRRELDDKYDFGESSYEGSQQLVDAYNAGKPVGMKIPAAERELGAIESTIADYADSDLGVGVKNYANAMAFGVPELLAGRQGRATSELADDEHWKSALTGEILGSLAPSVALERLALKGITRGAEATMANRVSADVMANAGYGAVRGANEAETEDRLTQTGVGAAGGLVGSLVGRGMVQGAKGFMGKQTTEALDDLGKKTFEMPAERAPLPADKATPARFQSMTDDELAGEAMRARQGAEAYTNFQKQALVKARQVAQSNVKAQKDFIAKNTKFEIRPEAKEAIRQQAAKQFPTDVEDVLKLPQFADEAKAALQGLEPFDVLKTRAERIEEHLLQDPTVRTGEIPGVDLTTMQRAGKGEAEAALGGAPFVHGARQASVASFNKQNAARVLANVGETLPKDIEPGQATNAYVNGQLNKAYSRIKPQIKGTVDRGFTNAVSALRKSSLGNGSPERKELWGLIEEQLSKFMKPDGTYDGFSYQEASSGLRRLSETMAKSEEANVVVVSDELSRAAEQVRRQMQALVGRTDPAVGAKLKRVEKAWAHQIRIEAASNTQSAMNQRGVYAPSEYLGAVRRLDTSKRKAKVARGKGMDQPYAQNAQQIIGDKPTSKASLPTAAAGAAALHYGGPLTVAVATALGAGYTPGVKRLVQAIVDGKLGKTPAAIEKAMNRSDLAKDLDTSTRRAIMAQLVREKAQNAGD